jgi:hypothetical protein
LDLDDDGDEARNGELLSSKSSTAGVMRNMFNPNGADEYNVMAKRIAETFSRKSAVAATGV